VRFFAAGAGHFAEGGVPEQLVEKGNKVIRVEE
jgi:uncharacterized protein YbaP (TraB family)